MMCSGLKIWPKAIYVNSLKPANITLITLHDKRWDKDKAQERKSLSCIIGVDPNHNYIYPSKREAERVLRLVHSKGEINVMQI